MLDNLTMDLIFTNVESESPQIDTQILICLTSSCCSITLKGLMNSSTEPLLRPSRSYVAASIGSLFTYNRRNLQARNYNINSVMLSPTVFEGPSWENCLSQVCRDWKNASEMKNIFLSTRLRRTMPH